ncbi:complex I NDUFA9 subunit family protein [Acidocella sp. KAb 2-4]|uniref:complex I NDUFA9 subunit family protein n=1 Tax=Acidocella sp. KAb 2-4 TaxID=2885158 RepID=UPI001D07284A|nr:complex I NDUFA9 subunit family protein [Acidocella sp. KAb 2-4]MCB5943221.1 complex I NDUFA9 subunit family protein [Acidocella sp. KAb 2-4]
MGAERKIAVVFGGSGFLGRYVVQRLADRGYLVRVAVRDTESAKQLQPLGGVAQIVPLYAPVGNEAAAARALAGAELAVNLVGILAESRKGDFDRAHTEGAGRIARLAAASGVARLVHVSAIGADAASASLYARSKGLGEVAVRAAFPGAVILRPSIVFGSEDGFFNRFAAMAQVLPVLPIVHGATKFQPVYVGDVADAVLAGLDGQAGRTFELGGPEVARFIDLLRLMLRLTGRHCAIWDMPVGLARAQAALLERLPGKLLTNDQITLLERDNVVAPGALGLESLGIAPTPMAMVVPQYLARYREGGKGPEAVFWE